MDSASLRAAVAHEFETTGAATPGWPDPYPDRDAPDDTYSRCLDPGKYAIVGARVRAWTNVLQSLAIVERHADTTVLRPHRAGAVPLVFTVRSALASNDVVDIAAGDPAVEIERVPDCGCDHCDSGSADLLQSLDDAIVPVVDGRFVHVSGPGWTLRTTDIGWASSGDVPGDRRGHHDAVEKLIADARAGRSPYKVILGASWLDD